MATAESVKAKLRGLIDRANGVTGQTSANLTAAVEQLAAGYGQGGAGMTTVSVNVTVYGSANMVYMGSGGARSVENPNGAYDVVRGSPLLFFYDGGTCLADQGYSGVMLYANTGDYNGHSCAALAFYDDGYVVFEEK